MTEEQPSHNTELRHEQNPEMFHHAPKPKKNKWLVFAAFTGSGCLLLIIFFFLFMMMLGSIFAGLKEDPSQTGLIEKNVYSPETDLKSKNKIAVISVAGIIADGKGSGSPDVIMTQLYLAQKDEDVKAVILEVNSPGGGVGASDAIYNAILTFKKSSGKPVIVFMKSLAASGGYYISAPADRIIATPTTITGSIGVILALWNAKKLLEDKIGIKMELYTSGENKDLMSPVRERGDDEKVLIKQGIGEMFERFKAIVKEHRKIDPANEKAIFDGRTFIAGEAHKLGLVDELGYFNDAIKQAKKLANISAAKVVRYSARTGLFGQMFQPFGKNEIKVNLNLPTPFSVGSGYMYIHPDYITDQNTGE